MSIETPRIWLYFFQYDDNKNKTDSERRRIVMGKLEHESGKNCFLSASTRPKLKNVDT